MTIAVDDLKFFLSERMTDNSDGGGQRTATPMDRDHPALDSLTDVDRAGGDVSIRKIYGAVESDLDEKYLDAGAVVWKGPADPAMSVLIFSTGDHYDERDDIKSRLEQTISRGARWNGWLWGQHLVGQRAVVIWQRQETPLPAVGHRLELVAKAGSVEQHNQFLWVTKVTDSLITRYDSSGSYVIRSVTCDLAEPLTDNYTGNEPTRADPEVGAALSLIYDTRYNADSVALHSVKPLVADAEVGDYTIQVDGLTVPVIPTALSETALPDVTPGANSAALVAARPSGTTSFTTSAAVVGPGLSLFIGGPCTPGTLDIAVSGAHLTDTNGQIFLAGAVVGTLNYGQGVASFLDTCPAYGAASKTVTYRPAARPTRIADTVAQPVTAENRGYVWVLTLAPIPAPGSLSISYRANGAWYSIADLGNGTLTGADSAYGSASLDFGTGTVVLTTGALPDVDSEIIYTWGTPYSYTARGGSAVDAPVVRGQTAHPAVAPGTVSVSWKVGATTYTLDDDPTADGNLTGTGGVGCIRYATGEWWVRPTTLPAAGTEFEISYDWGTPVEETFAHPARDGEGEINLTLNAGNLLPGSVEVEFNLLVEAYTPAISTTWEMVVPPTNPVDPIKIIQDDGAGALIMAPEGTNGSVNYTAGTLTLLPDLTISVPQATYRQVQIGTQQVSGGGGSVYEVNTYRTIFDAWEYIPTGAYLPIDESGWVKVRYRVTGGDTSATETVVLSSLTLDLTRGYAEHVTRGSVQFRIGTSRFVETNGQIYLDPSASTGAGTLVGALDPTTGRVFLYAWTGGVTNAVTLDALVTEVGGQPVEEVVFRTPVAPIKPGTLQLRFMLLDGTVKTKTVDSTGKLEDADCTIRVDYLTGVCRARFGLWKLDSALSPEEKLEPWYDPDWRVSLGGVLYIWKPALVLADSVIYNAVAQTFLPPDSTLLGIDAARMPPDGNAVVYSPGRLLLLHHPDELPVATLAANQVIDCGRTRLYRVVITDSLGSELHPSQYEVNRELGTITMSPSLDQTGFTPPWTVTHHIADLSRIVSTDINGTIALLRPVTHAFPADESLASSVLFAGTLQARYSNLFAQSAWTGEWSDELIGSEPLAQYADSLYPIIVTNKGCPDDRILIKFTSSTQFQVIGENLGLVGVGDTATNTTPTNPLTGEVLFTLDYRGWGTGWATGNCLRFNLSAADVPIDLVRATQPSSPTGLPDEFELLLIGNIEA